MKIRFSEGLKTKISHNRAIAKHAFTAAKSIAKDNLAVEEPDGYKITYSYNVGGHIFFAYRAPNERIVTLGCVK